MSHYLRLFLFVLMLCSMGLLHGQGPGKKAYLVGEDLRKENKCEDAIKQYANAIKQEPTNYKYFFQKGKCEYKIRDYTAAKISFKRTIEFKSDYTAAYSLLAKIYRMEKDYDNAIFYYKEAATFESSSTRKVQYKLLLVNLLLKERRIAEAQKHIKEAQEIDATNPNILFYIAEINGIEGFWERARENYESALASQRLAATPPAEKAKYYYGLGVAYSQLGDHTNAKKAWDKANFGPYKALIAKELEKNNHVHYYKVAVSYYLQGEYDISESYLTKALDLDSGFASAYVLKGKISAKQGNHTKAIEYYQQAISMEDDPAKTAQIRVLEAGIHLDNQQGQRALAAIRPAVALAPANTEWQFMKARAAYLAGEYREAIITVEKLLTTNPDAKTKAKYNFLLGMAAKHTLDEEKAADAFKHALYGPYKAAARVELEKLKSDG